MWLWSDHSREQLLSRDDGHAWWVGEGQPKLPYYTAVKVEANSVKFSVAQMYGQRNEAKVRMASDPNLVPCTSILWLYRQLFKCRFYLGSVCGGKNWWQS